MNINFWDIDRQWDTKQWDAIQIIRKTFLEEDFYKKNTRKSIKAILIDLEPHVSISNPKAFRGMTKRRMIKHIECYILLHDIKCEKPYLQCKLCNENIGNDEEILWGHIQMNHEEQFEEVRDWESPDMIDKYYK